MSSRPRQCPRRTLRARSWLCASLVAAFASFASAQPSTTADACPTAPAADDGIRICAWNLRNLGTRTSETLLSTVSRFVEGSCDVVAFLEVRRPDGTIRTIGTRLGEHWHVAVSDTGYPVGARRREHAALAWRTERAAECDGWTGLRAVEDADAEFSRPPSFDCLDLRAPDGDHTEALVGTFHATFASPAAIRGEVLSLPAAADRAHAARPSATHVLLAGDFNAALLPPLDEVLRAGVLPTDAGALGGTTLRRDGTPGRSVYDHVLAFDDMRALDAAHVADARACAGGADAYVRDVSDHLPVVAVLHVHAP